MQKKSKLKFIVNSIALKNLRAGWKHIYLYAKDATSKNNTAGR